MRRNLGVNPSGLHARCRNYLNQLQNGNSRLGFDNSQILFGGLVREVFVPLLASSLAQRSCVDVAIAGALKDDRVVDLMDDGVEWVLMLRCHGVISSGADCAIRNEQALTRRY